MIRIGIVSVACLFVLACGKKSDDPVSSNKSLFSLWNDHTSGKVLDLRGGSFGTSQMYFVFNTGGKCVCTLDTVGDSAQGNYVLSVCTYAGGGVGDPGCAGVNQSGIYDNYGNALQICSGGLCSIYN